LRLKGKFIMKKLLIYLKDYKRECVCAPLFKMFEALLELFVPLVMASIIDVGIAGGDSAHILRMGLVLVGLAAVGLAASVTAQYFAAKAATGFATKLRHALFNHIQGFSFSQMDTEGTSTLITRMTSDINQTQSGVNMVLRLFLRSPFIVFGAMIMAFTINARLALIFVATIPLLSIVVFGIMKVTMPLYKRVQGLLDQVLCITRENLTGARVIRAFNKEADEKKHFDETNGQLTDMQKFVGKISALTNPVTYIIINGATLCILYGGAVKVDSGIITQGTVVALVNYMSQILVELIKLANLIVTITKALASAGRIQGVFEIEVADEISTNAPNGNTASPIVEFRNVSLTYRNGGEEALKDISFKVQRGQTVGIIGGTGSGKSSIVNLIPGFYDATRGTVLIGGEDVKSLDPSALRKKIGMVFQKNALFKGSIRDNMRLGNQNATDDEIIRALQISQSLEFVQKKEGFLDFMVEQDGKNLSGGQKQRLCIARALVAQPDILILDDSASALDFATDAALRKSLSTMNPSPTLFIVSQRAASLMHADLIIVLDDGQLAGIGTHKQLLSNCEVYQEIYYSQYPKEVAM
jgi:ABC-type multidrug transport system fused ATPase/permease subunit